MHNFSLNAANDLGFDRVIRHFDNDGFQGQLTHIVDGERVAFTDSQMEDVNVKAQELEDSYVAPE